jgi:hypothetical protein
MGDFVSPDTTAHLLLRNNLSSSSSHHVPRAPRQPRCSQLCIPKHTDQFGKAQIGDDDTAAAFLELTERVEQSCDAGLVEG